MTTHKDTAGIIERLEAASGPDRELDLDISVAINFKEAFTGYDGWHWNVMGDEIEAPYIGKKSGKPARAFLDPAQFVPRWTASIDSALSLVPEGWDWTLVQRKISPYQKLFPYEVLLKSDFLVSRSNTCQAFGFTLPLTLCAAALRARAHKAEG